MGGPWESCLTDAVRGICGACPLELGLGQRQGAELTAAATQILADRVPSHRGAPVEMQPVALAMGRAKLLPCLDLGVHFCLTWTPIQQALQIMESVLPVDQVCSPAHGRIQPPALSSQEA